MNLRAYVREVSAEPITPRTNLMRVGLHDLNCQAHQLDR